MIVIMSSEHLGALLTLVGLAAEMIAVVAILIAVGMPGRISAKARSTLERLLARWRRLKDFARRRWPWSKRETVYTDAALGNLRSSGTGSGSLRLETGMRPRNFLEVGERLDELREKWNEHERAIEKQARDLRAELAGLDRLSAERVDEIDQKMKEEARRTLAERTTEGVLLALGIACQVAGAAIVLLN
ncbi:MAG TPA: hypothetical protein VGC49_11145 [Solirubrobacterales bacterium]|jgi:hypothetical protein